MLALACAALDRAESCRAQIDSDGEIVRGKSGPREHPLIEAELSNRAFVARSLSRLGLDVEPMKDWWPTGLALVAELERARGGDGPRFVFSKLRAAGRDSQFARGELICVNAASAFRALGASLWAGFTRC